MKGTGQKSEEGGSERGQRGGEREEGRRAVRGGVFTHMVHTSTRSGGLQEKKLCCSPVPCLSFSPFLCLSRPPSLPPVAHTEALVSW